MAPSDTEEEVTVTVSENYHLVPPTLFTTSFSRDTLEGRYLGLGSVQLSMGERPPSGPEILALTAPGHFGTPSSCNLPQASTPAVKEVPFSGSKLGTPISQPSNTLSTPSKYD